MKIDGLHPNAKSVIESVQYDEFTRFGPTLIGALPKHIHIKPKPFYFAMPTTLEEANDPNSRGYSASVLPNVSLEVQPTEVAEYLDWCFGKESFVKIEPSYLRQVQEKVAKLVSDRERKAAVEALKKLTHYESILSFAGMALVKQLIVEYERGEANE